MRELIYFSATISVLAVISGSHLNAATCDQDLALARPIELGVSGGNINLSATVDGITDCCEGTLGSLVTGSGGKYILSNNHVLARVNLAKPGEAIIQPGLIADGCPSTLPTEDVVAHLSASSKIKFRGQNNIDAAIAQVAAGDVTGDILNIGPISGKTVAAPSALNLAVQKMGRTTCLTTGTVSAINADVEVEYVPECNSGSGTALFVNQIVVTGSDFAAGGDSGSLVVTQEDCPRAVGLLFASGSASNQTILNPIRKVLGHFGVSMVAGCEASPQAADTQAEVAGSSGAAGLAGLSAEAINAVTAIKERHENDLFALPGVVGTAVGSSSEPGVPKIEVYIAADTPALRAALPAEIEGAQVDVIVSGPFTAW
ncbi:MAG: hypothetical protein ABSG46_14035 [Candidatus Binataceae bacterium]